MPPSIPLDVLGNANNCTKSTFNGIDGGTMDNSFIREDCLVYLFPFLVEWHYFYLFSPLYVKNISLNVWLRWKALD